MAHTERLLELEHRLEVVHSSREQEKRAASALGERLGEARNKLAR